jgi:hypothetical protein
MAPFVYPLEEMLKGPSKADRTATSNAKFSVEMWRVAAIILTLQPDVLAMPIPRLIGTLEPTTVLLRCTADAGPRCLGLALYHNNTGTEVLHTSFVLPFGPMAQLPAYQNYREFCGIVLGMLCAHLFRQRCGIPPNAQISISWTGDNTTALQWVHKNKCKSGHTQRAFMVYTWLYTLANVTCDQTQHQAGLLMGYIDALSRERAVGLNAANTVETSTHGPLVALFGALDPTIKSDQTRDHHVAFSQVHKLLVNVLQ